MKTSLSLRLAAIAVFAGLAAVAPGPVTRMCQAAPLSPAPYAGPVLSAAQKLQVQSLQQQAFKKLQVIGSNTKLTPQQQFEQKSQLQIWFNTQTMALLTPAQRADLVAHREAFQKQAQITMTQAKALNSQLMKSLTPKQQSDIKAAVKSVQQQRLMLVQNSKLTEQQKDDQYRTILASNATKIQTILTPQQRALSAKIDALVRQLRQMSPQGQAPQPQ